MSGAATSECYTEKSDLFTGTINP